MVEGLARCDAAWPGRPIRIAAQQRLEPFYASLGFRSVTECTSRTAFRTSTWCGQRRSSHWPRTPCAATMTVFPTPAPSGVFFVDRRAASLVTHAAHHRRAIAFMVVAAICWSSGGLLVRALSITNAWEIVFWRSLFMALFVAGVLLAMHGRRMPQAVVAIGWPGLVSGLFLAGTFFFFIGSLTRTTVANTFVLMSVSPFLAAIAGRVFLRGSRCPRAPGSRWSVAFAGIVVMFADSLDAGRLSGNLLALGVSCCFAAQVTVLRKYHAHVDMLPQVMVAGSRLARTSPPRSRRRLPRRGRDLGILALMGCVQLGTGCLLATAASRHLSATELGLLALLEPILGPLWVWALMGEAPGRAALTGGAIVLTAVDRERSVRGMARARDDARGRETPSLLPPGP